MTDQELTQRVISIVTTQQKLPAGTVQADSTFEELGIDSLDGIQLLFTFEEEFGLSIPDEVARRMKSVRQTVDALRPVLASAAADEAAAAGAVGAP